MGAKLSVYMEFLGFDTQIEGRQKYNVYTLHHQDQVCTSLLQFRFEKRMKDTYQEETLQKDVSQEEMATPIDDTTTQKIFKAIEKQRDALKKIGCHLSKLEESKLKKPLHVEIHDEGEGKTGMKGIRLYMKGTKNLRNSPL